MNFLKNLKTIARSVKDTFKRGRRNLEAARNPKNIAIPHEWTVGTRDRIEPAKKRGSYAAKAAKARIRRRIAKRARKVMYARRKANGRTF